MSSMSTVLTGLMLLALVVYMAPNIFALNRGHILRNIALWLAVFLGLAVFFQTFGPGSPHPLFQMPASMADMHGNMMEQNAAPVVSAPDKDEKNEGDDGSQGYTPPKE